MKAYWNLVASRIDALSLRERALVFFSIVAMFYMAWNIMLLSPQQSEANRLKTQLGNLDVQLKSKQDELALFTHLTKTGNLSPAQKKQQALQGELETLNKELSTLSQGLISAEDLPVLLQDVLLNSKGLRLLSVQTLPVESLVLQAEELPDDSSGLDEDYDSEPSSEMGVFKHGTALTIKGSYFQVLNYVRALESLPWRFYWDWLNYSVVEYPNAEIEIRVYTLSAEEGLLGV